LFSLNRYEVGGSFLITWFGK